MRQIDEIIIHCTATPEGRTTSVPDVDAWHRQRGFAKIGYHYLIGLNGEIWPGRSESETGAHCLNHNAKSIGVCYVGGMTSDGKTPKDTRTAGQKNAMEKLLKELKNKYPKATIHGHNEFAARACPSFSVKQWLKDVNI